MSNAYLALMLMIWIFPLQSADANFSGNWVYDAAASELPHNGDFTIFHFGNRLTMTFTKQNGTSSIEYNLDSLEHSVETGERIFTTASEFGWIR